MYTVYIIFSEKSGTYYTGVTFSLEDRLRHHNSGATKSTRSGRPWKVIHTERFDGKREAWLRERQIKRYKGGAAFKQLIGRHGEVA